LRVILYTKHACSLCERAEDALRRAQREIDFDLELVLVDHDRELLRLYGDRVPVITVDGTEVASAPLDEAALLAALSGAA
jgi:glutaredoxin